MATNPEIILKIGTLITDEQFAGEKCVNCDDFIYGTGFRVVVTTSTEKIPLPRFKESNIVLCSSCKDALK